MRLTAPLERRIFALAVLSLVTAGIDAAVPFPASSGQSDVDDYASYLFVDSGDCSDGNTSSNDLPDTFDCEGDWKFTDYRDPTQLDTASNPQEFYGVKGAATNRAYEVTTGRPDVAIAIVDSGTEWDSKQPGLINKYYLNRGELPMPSNGPNKNDTRFGGYDVNGDGVFNMADYADDGRVSDLNGNGMKDPGDLIRVFSDGSDDDNNGYIDDISGWDFYEDDNDAQDDVDYGHGHGRARDAAEDPGSGDGQCPNCMIMQLRVGSSFIADVNHFAEATVYAVDNGARVIEDALGTLNHSSYGQAAVDYAYENGVIINASEADEAAAHHNWPAAYDHNMVVNSITQATLPTTSPQSTLYLNGCTNFGGYSFVSIPTASCSSEATGRSAGISGLLMSAALNAVDRNDMSNYIRDDGSEADYPLSAEEAMQLWRLAADDIDFSSGCPGHAFCDDAPDGVLAPAAVPSNYVTTTPLTTRYKTVKGWDFFTGYGRANNGRLMRFIGVEDVPDVDDREAGPATLTAQDRIPPEADIDSPRWWAQFPYSDDGERIDGGGSDIVIAGHAAANRVTADGGTFDYVLEWAPRVQGQGALAGSGQAAQGSEEKSAGPWTTISERSGLSAPVNGQLGTVAVSDLAAGLDGGPKAFSAVNDPTSRFQPEKYAIRLRLRVIAHPVNDDDTINNEAVMQKQVDVYPADEDTIVENLGMDGQPSGGAASPSFHDIDGDGKDELLLPTTDGLVHAYTNVRTGAELPGWPVHTTPYQVRNHATGNNAYTSGAVSSTVFSAVLLGSAAVADLDNDGRVEVLVADLSGHLHAWEPDGSPREGFPISVDYDLSRQRPCGPSTAPDCDDYAPGPKVRDKNNNRDWAITSQPSIGDLDPDTDGLEIVFGSNDGHVYAVHDDGTPVTGWPVVLRDPAKVKTMDEKTHVYTYKDDADARDGSKVIVTPGLGDLNGDGTLEVVASVNEEYVEDPNANGISSIVLPIIGALADPGNTRVYALHHDGAAHDPNADDVNANVTQTPHTQDQAYVKGWPVPLALVQTELLPEVGTGSGGQPVLADTDGDGQLEVVTASVAGPGYVLNGDGSSALGSGPSGMYRTLATAGTGPATGAQDTPSYVALGALTLGSMDGSDNLTIAGSGGGLRRVLDILVEGKQLGAEDQIQLWGARSGLQRLKSPVVVNDLQFLIPPIFADITGDGQAEVIQSTAVNDTVAIGLLDSSLNATRYHSGGWGIASAALGAAPIGENDTSTGEDKPPVMRLATLTREGFLRLYPTADAIDGSGNCTALSQWPESGHDAFNSGNYTTDAERPYPLRELAAGDPGDSTSVALTFLATGDDRDCGKADHYEVRQLSGGASSADWLAAKPVKFDASEPGAPGEAQTLNVGPLPDGQQTLLVRAFDEAGNGSAVASVPVRIGSDSGSGGNGDSGDNSGNGGNGGNNGGDNGSGGNGSGNGNTGGGSNGNAGGNRKRPDGADRFPFDNGGCTLVGHGAFDPIWAFMLLLAIGVLGDRRRRRG